jgi:hypothetical protein
MAAIASTVALQTVMLKRLLCESFCLSYTDIMKITCPVCSYELDFWPVRDEICHNCGIQFGLDDAVDSLDLQLATYSEWRKAWNENGKQKLSNDQIAILHDKVKSSYS